ncbi:MAG: hypothetical protein ACOCYV_01065 [Planctomycetota bacterium]
MVDLPVLLACFTAALIAGGEWLHARRCRRAAVLVHGPGARPRRWVAVHAPLRVIAAAALAWGLGVLATAGAVGEENWWAAERPRGDRHLLAILDVSPSMEIADAGIGGETTRAQRARAMLQRLLDRVGLQNLRVSLIAAWTDALPVLQSTRDRRVIDNVLADLPLHYAFSAGPTDLRPAPELAGELARPWPPGSTTLLLLSDGQPELAAPRLPAAIDQVLIIGLGDTRRARAIDGFAARQYHRSLRRLAHGLGGDYIDGTRAWLPEDACHGLGAGRDLPTPGPDRTAFALLAIALGATVLAGVPVLLRLAGSPWPARLRRARAGSAGGQVWRLLSDRETLR